MLSSAVPEALQLAGGTNEAVAFLKTWQGLLLDYISFLGVVIAGFGIYSISLTSAAEQVQCIPMHSLQNISCYSSLKDYVNGECSGDEKVRLFIGYPYFLLLIWFCLVFASCGINSRPSTKKLKHSTNVSQKYLKLRMILR